MQEDIDYLMRALESRVQTLLASNGIVHAKRVYLMKLDVDGRVVIEADLRQDNQTVGCLAVCFVDELSKQERDRLFRFMKRDCGVTDTERLIERLQKSRTGRHQLFYWQEW